MVRETFSRVIIYLIRDIVYRFLTISIHAFSFWYQLSEVLMISFSLSLIEASTYIYSISERKFQKNFAKKFQPKKFHGKNTNFLLTEIAGNGIISEQFNGMGL